MEFEDIDNLKIKEREKEGLYILKKNADMIQSFVVNRDYDWFHLVIGREGVGKSSFAVLFAKLVDPTFSVERVVFSYEDFKRAVVTAQPGQCILVDEGGLLFFSRNAMKGQQKEIVQLLTIMRQRNLIIIICIPSIAIVESYIKEHRVRSLTVMKARGKAWGYGQNKVARIIGIMKKMKGNASVMNLIPPGFKLSVPDAKIVFPEFWEIYRKKKDAMIIGKHIMMDDLLEGIKNKEEVLGEDRLYNRTIIHICKRYGLSRSTFKTLEKKYPQIIRKDVLGRTKVSEAEFEKIYYPDKNI